MVLKNIDYHVCDTCNLNCISCNHFSPIADKPNFKTIEESENDFQILNKFSNHFDILTILGGEPLLNNDIGKIIEIANKYFPNRIKLITNGVLYNKLIDIKDIIIDNNIKLVVTEYPFSDNYKSHYKKIKNWFPNVEFYEYRIEHGFLKHHLSYADTGLTKEKIYDCDKRYKCCNYVDGKLYICHYAAFLPYLNNVTDFAFDNSDAYIDLTKCTINDFDSFFKENIPTICKHCLYAAKSYDEHEKQKWDKSQNQVCEWII